MERTSLAFLSVLLASLLVGVHSQMFVNPATRLASIQEGRAVGMELLTAGGSSIDLAVTPDSATFTYSLSGENNLFEVSTDDKLTVKTVIDREMPPSGVDYANFEFTVQLLDASNTMTDSITIRVNVIDVNDNPPVWDSTQTPAMANENGLPVGFTIINLAVTDADAGLNARLTYAVTAPGIGSMYEGVIEVSPSGRVYLAEEIGNINVDTTISITITISDRGSTPMTGTATFDFMIVNALEAPPTFTQNTYEVNNIAENVENATGSVSPIVTVQAINHPTSSSNNEVRYNIVEAVSGFSISVTSGAISFNGNLDRERQSIIYITVRAVEVLSATDSTEISFPAYASVILTLADINDNAPMFHNGPTVPYTAIVAEDVSVGFITIDDATAFDTDEGSNALFEYSIDPSDSSVPFEMNPDTGVISVSASLDYETTQSYSFTVLATETSTTPRLTGSAMIMVIVTNVNDNAPEFPSDVYTFEVNEGPSSGTALTGMAGGRSYSAITANDTDLGEFGVVDRYQLISATDNPPFAVSPDGELFVTGTLDRETQTSYHFSLRATDTGGLSDTTLLIIAVLDVNDNAPIFVPDSYTLILVEGTDYPSVITLLATDRDLPNTDNSAITYSISPTTNAEIDSSTGAVSITGLDCETAMSHSLTVTAVDAGTTPMSGTATISITVQCINEHGPIFDPASYSVSITEAHAVGTGIGITVSATDQEAGHTVAYSIPGTDGRFFNIDSASGVISLAHELDYEDSSQRTMSFQVVARDDAQPPLSSQATVTLTVTNVNDNTPVITNPPSRDSPTQTVTEGAGVTVPNSLLTVDATDGDGDTITFSISGSSSFSIDAMGVVTQTAQLDRETSATETLTVMACDPSNACDSVTMTINVADFNDNPPVFTSTSYAATISECNARAEVSILTVSAQDTVDIGANSDIVYSIATGASTFSVGRGSGIVRLVGNSWNFEDGITSFTGSVTATDNPDGTPQMTATASFTLTLTDCNDLPPVFGSEGYTLSVTEGATSLAAGSTVPAISTNDGDTTASFKAVTYTIVGGPAAANNWITIDSSSGALSLLTAIDRESPLLQVSNTGTGVFSFQIQATNTAMGPGGTTLQDTATVTVQVSDINDHDPIIQNPNPLVVSVVENALNGSIVAVISATDLDFGDNAHISYSITAGNTDDTFAIDDVSGHITVAKQANLDREGTHMYTLTVQAENDLATGGIADTITVMISTIGTNDHSPIFGQDQYVTDLREYDDLLMTNGAMVNATVQTVEATDADGPSTPAGQIEYRILSGNMQNGEVIFDILSPMMGAVIVLRPDLIDYEMRTQFDIVVEAYDTVSPVTERRQDSTHVIVNIIDVNDNIPMFANAFYNATIIEEEATEAMVIPSIRATDPDVDNADPLEFSLVSGDPFTISLDGTAVTTTARIDRETTDSYSAIVVVRDSAGHSSSAELSIVVVDINDNSPHFVVSTPGMMDRELVNILTTDLNVNIPENLNIFPHMDGIVQTVTAVDNDIDNNAQITYRLSGGRGNFEITQTTGEIRLISSLDRDTIASVYNLNVTATDGTLTSWIAFDIIIDNVNDNNPVFLETVYEGTVDEDSPMGTTVLLLNSMSQIPEFLEVEAEDLDPESNVTYFLSPESSSLSLPFQVTIDGFIVTSESLDRENQERFSFFVRATDGFRVSLDDTLIEIVIGDVNDEPPEFEQPSYTTDVYELTPVNAIFLILQATDDDIGSNADITYSITATDPIISTDNFGINAQSGALFPNEDVSIAQGEPQTITLTVTATDNGTTQLSTSVQVELNIVDRNLNAPNFTQILYEFSVDENMMNAVVGNPIARDSTGDLNVDLTYRIVDNSDGHENFFINNATGEIRTAASLDREERDLFTITVSAADSADIPRTGFTTVVISVNDINDNDPFFDPDSYPVATSESSNINSTVIRVLAFDNDIGANAQLSYRILSGDRSVFSITDVGDIITIAKLDREQMNSYELIVEVRDSVLNPRSALTNVTVTINDVNDNSPTFTSGAVLSTDPVEILEDVESGHLITTIQAVDPDFQLNGIVGYYFQNLTLTMGPFQIDRVTGAITLRSGDDGNIDREERDSYELIVIAADRRGLDIDARMTSGTVMVNILDINDNIPTFIDPLYEFTIPEAYPLNTVLGQVEGDDEDIGINAALYYHIIGTDLTNTTCADQFCIDLTTGEITLIQTLDRETSDSHLLTVAVTNYMELQFNDTTGSPIAASTGSISVVVTDTNDQTPVFVESSLFAVVAEEAEFGTTIATLEALDSDTLNGSVVWFEIITPQVPYLVDRDTGIVTTAGVFTGLSGTKHEVMVRAFDNFGIVPTFSSTGVMIVQVFRRSEQIILTFQQDKETIEVKINRIHAALVEVTSARITITEVRVERTVANEVDISGTDVFFFALDPVSGGVINPAIVLRLIDENYQIVENVFTECQIESVRINTEPVDATPVVPVWVWVILGILALAVICMCCCFLIGCVVERRRSRRWKKKAAAGHSVEQFSHMTDYNTMNNPLWFNPYEGLDYTSSSVSTGSTQQNSNPLYESQELTIEMFQDDEEDTKSRELLIKAPSLRKPAPKPVPKPVEPVLRKRSDGLFDSQEIEIPFGHDDLEDPESETNSDIQLLRSSTPHGHGLKGKRGGKGRSYYSRDDELLDEAVSYID